MKKKEIVITAVIFLLCIIIGIIAYFQNQERLTRSTSKTNESQVDIYSIEMTIASKNKNHVYWAENPVFYCTCNDKYGDYRNEHFVTEIDVISREDFNFFADFINKNDQGFKPEGAVFAYEVWLSYYDENDDYQDIVCWGYDSFPEELNGVIDKFNELSGEKVFDYPSELVTDLPAFVYEEYDMDKTDYSLEDVKEALEYFGYSFKDVVEGFSPERDLMKKYYRELDAKTIEYLMPTKEMKDRKASDVSDEEFLRFVQAFCRETNGEWQLGTDSFDPDDVYLYRYDASYKEGIGYFGYSIHIGKTVDIDRLQPDYENGTVLIVDDPSHQTPFIFDKSGTYFLYDFWELDDFAAIAEAFYRTE